MVETIEAGSAILAYVIRSGLPDATTFYTPSQAPLQVGHVVHPAGHRIARHEHKPVRRELDATAEILLVQKGECDVTFYDDSRHEIARRSLARGDIVILLRGGHGFEMKGDTVLLEVKQGPYAGVSEKEFF